MKQTARLLLLCALATGGVACGAVDGPDAGDQGGSGVPDTGGGVGTGTGGGTGSGTGGGKASGVLFSPYKDISINMDYNTNTISTLLSGARTPIAGDLTGNGTRAVSLAFATGACGSETWAGVPGPTLAQVNAPLLDAGGVDYILSTGGAAGTFTCASDADFATFIDRWMTPHLIGVDFDIETGQSPAVIDDLIRRIAPAHAKYPKLRFTLTIATIANSADGESLNPTGVAVVDALAKAFPTLPSYVTINLMTMDYGPAGPGVCVVANGACDMGVSATQAAHNLRVRHNIPLTNVEITPMIGGNDVQSNVFKLADIATVANYAAQNHLAGVHFWSYDRDIDCPPGAASATCNTLGGAGAHGFLQRFHTAGL